MKIPKELAALILFLILTTILFVGCFLNGLPVFSYGYDGFVVKALIVILGILFQILVLMLWPEEPCSLISLEMAMDSVKTWLNGLNSRLSDLEEAVAEG